MKAALIGVGMVADTHLAALRDNSAGVTLAGVLGRSPIRAQAFADRACAALGHDVTRYANLAALLADTPDLAIVTTPPDARLEIVAALAQARVPILLEKPLERSLSAATSLVVSCEAAGVPLGVVFQHRCRAASQALKTRMPELGDIALAEIRVPWWRDQSYYDAPGRGTYARDGGGVMLTQAIHTLDLAIWLLGPVAEVRAVLKTTPLHQMEAEDYAGALIRFVSGAQATFFATTAAYPGKAESLAVYGAKGSAHLEAGVLEMSWRSGGTDRVGDEAATGGGADPMAFTHGWHQSVLEGFATAVQSDTAPPITGRDALHVHAVIAALEEANRSGEAVRVVG